MDVPTPWPGHPSSCPYYLLVLTLEAHGNQFIPINKQNVYSQTTW